MIHDLPCPGDQPDPDNPDLKEPPQLEALNKWASQIGVSSSTIYRWRRFGWLKTIQIAGRPYVTREAARTFIEKAKAGDFSNTPAHE